MEACKQRYKTKYVRLPDLLLELEMARNDGTYKKVQGKYANPVLLIIDEWLLLKPTESEQHEHSGASFTGDAGSHLPSSVPSTTPVAGMTSLVVMTVLCRKRYWTASSMMHTRSISSQRIRRITDPCGRYMD